MLEKVASEKRLRNNASYLSVQERERNNAETPSAHSMLPDLRIITEEKPGLKQRSLSRPRPHRDIASKLDIQSPSSSPMRQYGAVASRLPHRTNEVTSLSSEAKKKLLTSRRLQQETPLSSKEQIRRYFRNYSNVRSVRNIRLHSRDNDTSMQNSREESLSSQRSPSRSRIDEVNIIRLKALHEPQVLSAQRNNPDLSRVSNRSNELSFIEASRSNHSVVIGERPRIKPIKVPRSSRRRAKNIDLFGKQNE